MQIRWVRQKEPNGCVAATLAMILGVTYSDARNMLGGPHENGCYSTERATKILWEHGWATCRLTTYRSNRQRRDLGRVKPFALVHLVSVVVEPTSPTYHSVVMLRDGRVLDPLERATRRLSDYHAVTGITGLHHLGVVP